MDVTAPAILRSPQQSKSPILEVTDLSVEFRTRGGVVHAVNGASYRVAQGASLAVVGESGSGKSVSAQAVMGILDSPPAAITGGTVLYRGQDILAMSARQQRRLRAEHIAMVFQDGLTALNPVLTVGYQISELFRVYRHLSRRTARQRAIEALHRVRIPAPSSRVDDYPHQLSGGMRQRVMIAMALALEPSVLIADEPTTALDVTVQAQIMALLRELQDENGMSLILITHDLALARENAEDIAVMYAGRIVESGNVRQVLARPAHPYTRGLMSSRPQASRKGVPLTPIRGAPPDLTSIPPGCPFHPRCNWSVKQCELQTPVLRPVLPMREVACHRSEEVLRDER